MQFNIKVGRIEGLQDARACVQGGAEGKSVSRKVLEGTQGAEMRNSVR